jgi:hypothetical protein
MVFNAVSTQRKPLISRHLYTLSHKGVLSTPRHQRGIRIHNFNGDRHWEGIRITILPSGMFFCLYFLLFLKIVVVMSIIACIQVFPLSTNLLGVYE